MNPVEFKQPSPLVFAIIFAVIVSIIATGLLLLDWRVSAAAYAFAIAIPLAVYFLSTRHIIRCTDEGFSVDKESRRTGKSHEEHRWTDVTRTAYSEHVSRSRKNGSSTMRYFEAHCGDKMAFKVSNVRRFRDLIKLFNEKTPQLPYTWEPRTGISFGIGALSASKAAYGQVPRAGSSAPSPAGAPPPLPPA